MGEVPPGRILTNAGLRPGDALVLTKPLGIGIATTAVKAGTAGAGLLDAAVATMCLPNAAAAAAALAADATGCTDVTGFGLLGPLRQMAQASPVEAGSRSGADLLRRRHHRHPTPRRNHRSSRPGGVRRRDDSGGGRESNPPDRATRPRRF